MNKKIRELLTELEHELNLMSVDELEAFRSEWVNELETKNLPEWIVDFCGYIVDRVIVEKAGGVI